MVRVVAFLFAVPVAGAAFLVVRGIGGVLRRNWKAAWMVLGGVALFFFTSVLLGVTASLFAASQVDGFGIEPSQKARILAENISELMNCSVLGFPLGVLAGLVAVVRDWRGFRRGAQGPTGSGV